MMPIIPVPINGKIKFYLMGFKQISICAALINWKVQMLLYRIKIIQTNEHMKREQNNTTEPIHLFRRLSDVNSILFNISIIYDIIKRIRINTFHKKLYDLDEWQEYERTVWICKIVSNFIPSWLLQWHPCESNSLTIPMAGTRNAEPYDAVTMLLHLSTLMGCYEERDCKERFGIQIFSSKDIKGDLFRSQQWKVSTAQLQTLAYALFYVISSKLLFLHPGSTWQITNVNIVDLH